MHKSLNIIVIVILLTTQTLWSQENQEYKYVQSDIPTDSVFFHYLLHQSVQSIFLHFDVITGGWAKSFIEEFNDPAKSAITPYITWEIPVVEAPDRLRDGIFLGFLQAIDHEEKEFEIWNIDNMDIQRKTMLLGEIPFEFTTAQLADHFTLLDSIPKRLHFYVHNPKSLRDGTLYYCLGVIDIFGNLYFDFYVTFRKCLFGGYYIPVKLYHTSAFVFEWHERRPVFELDLNSCDRATIRASNDYERK